MVVHISLYNNVQQIQIKELIAHEGRIHLIEAFPGSKVVSPPDATNPTEQLLQPTLVYGYVCGLATYDSSRAGNYEPGTTIIHGLMHQQPSQFGEASFSSARDWTHIGLDYCLAIGEVTDFAQAEKRYKAIEHIQPDGALLSNNSIRQITQTLAEYARQRRGKEYFFDAPKKGEYTLRDVVLSLRPVRQ